MKIPDYVENTIKNLEAKGYEAYIVGGCVRDLLMDKIPKDWDITTNARPEEIVKLFDESKYENEFGTVLVPAAQTADSSKQTAEKIMLEVTTYRSEQGYRDKRHPDKIIFEDELEKDLMRRDFTMNALAMNTKREIIDLFGGEKDIKKKIIRAVGEPVDRFKEDALRMMRAVRLSAELDFGIEPKTERAIIKMAGSIKFIANERIKDELVKIIASDRAYEGMMKLYDTKLLNYIIPEMLTGVGVKQNHHHIYSVFKHAMLSLKNSPSKEWQVRMAAMFHDIGKPKAKKIINGAATFYNHEYIGERMVRKIMARLKFATDDINRVANLVRNHMFYYNADEVTAASVRRLINKVGRDNLKDLIDMRIADRLGSGTPKAKPYKLRHLEYMFERVQNDPVSVKMLKLNGDHMIAKLGFKPGPKMGAVLDVLLSEVIEDPKMNNLKYLAQRAKELDKDDLKALREKAKEKIEEKQSKDDQKMKEEFWVK